MDIRNSRQKSRSSETSDLWRILSLYFPQIRAEDSEGRCNLTSCLFHFFSSPQAQQFVCKVKEEDGLFFLPLDFQEFRKVCDIEEFYVALEENPKEALLCMSAALHKVIFMKRDFMEDCAKINVRLHNYQESMIALKNLKAAYIDRLVSVRGTVVKVSTVRPLVMQMSFSCAKCGTTITTDFPDGKFTPPIKCEMQACKSRIFNPNRSTAQLIDFQKIRIQELLKSEHHEEGRVPRAVECELTHDLVDACIPGDVVSCDNNRHNKGD